MIVFDVNVLVALFRGDHADHALTLRWWEEMRAAGTPFTVPDLVWVGVVRVLTNPRVFADPEPVVDAFALVDSVTQQPTYVEFRAQPGVMSQFRELCLDGRATGNLVTDAYIAATATTVGAAVATFDRDFRRFDGLRILDPSASS